MLVSELCKSAKRGRFCAMKGKKKQEKQPKMLTVKEVAELVNASARAVRLWAKSGRLPGAELIESPFGAVWMIPDTAIKGLENQGPGRPRKPLSELKSKPRRKD